MRVDAGNTPAVQATRRQLHVRSQSFSTLDERRCHAQDGQSGNVRIVIDQNALTKRPRTTESDVVPQLEIPIPHYRLGNPYFSQRGTPILRSSVYTRGSATDDMRSSYLSKVEYDRLFPHPVTVPRHSILSRRHSEAFRQPHDTMQNHTTTYDLPAAVSDICDGTRSGLSATAAQTPSLGFALMPIAPEIFDIIAANPNDPSVVRYSSTGEMAAATPSRLIDHITSPSFLDYELLSDFFLTCRSFLKAVDLISYLFARLRWAVKRNNDFGRIVRVRTFVALRHWILNYFVDDFIPDFALRSQFCKAVNELSRELQNKDDGTAGDLKILGELKKCWRRTCMLYWENQSLQGSRSIEDDIHPGNPVNMIASPNTPTVPFLAKGIILANNELQSQGMPLMQEHPFQSALFVMPGANSRTKALPASHHFLASDRVSAQTSQNLPLSPMSEHSIQAASCSIPRFATPKIGCASDRPQQAQGSDVVNAANIRKPTRMFPPTSASTAGASGTGNGTRRTGRHKHKRSGSFSDALRDERASLSQPLSTSNGGQKLISTEMPPNDITGSLIRGAVFLPIEPYIEIIKHDHLASISQLDVNMSQNVGIFGEDVGFGGDYGSNDNFAVNGDANIVLSAMISSNPGVKKILGSVRRAISGRQPSEKIYAGKLRSQTSKAALTTVSAMSGTGSSSTTITGGGNNNKYNVSSHRNNAKGAKKKRRRDRDRDRDSIRTQVRVDLMAAKVVASYKEALLAKEASERERELMANVGRKTTQLDGISSRKANVDGLGIVETAAVNRESVETLKFKEKSDSNRITGGVTPGSRSIIIANDTTPLNVPSLPDHTKLRNLAEAIGNVAPQQRHEVNGNCMSSIAVQGHAASKDYDRSRDDYFKKNSSPTEKQSHDHDLPMNPLRYPRSIQGAGSKIGADTDVHAHSIQETGTSSLKKSKSTKSQRSGSASLRRYASYQSGIANQRFQHQHQPSGSVDAVTLTDVRSVSPQSSSPAPSLSSFPSPSNGQYIQKAQATRQLRRRPGGDLRAFGNVHELERPRSTGSVSNRTHSITNSMSFKPFDRMYANDQHASRGTNGLSRNHENALSTGQGGLARRPYSLVQTHSSQPNLRPSFEAEVAKLAALPDEDDEAVGVEAALLKLEGRFQTGDPHSLAKSSKRRSGKCLSQQKPDVDNSELASEAVNFAARQQILLSGSSTHNDKVNGFGNSLLPTISDKGSLSYRSLSPAGHDEEATTHPIHTRKLSLANSDDSYSSVPLLQRGLSQGANSSWRKAGEDFRIGNLQAAAQTKASIEREANATSFFLSPRDKSPLGVHNVTGDEHRKRRSYRSGSPSLGRKSVHSTTARDSFLLDSDQSLSDVASDISTGDLIMSTISGSQQVVSFYDDGVNYKLSRNNFRDEEARPDMFQYPPRHPPTPPLSEGSVNGAPDATRPLAHSFLQQQQEQLHQHKIDPTGTKPALKAIGVSQYFPHPPLSPVDTTGIEMRHFPVKNEPSLSHPSQTSSSPQSVPLKHIPFILAYDSEVLAQQFTIIEKDALDEIDWKELIELRWNQSATGVQTWVEYLLRDSTEAFAFPDEYKGNSASCSNIMDSKQRRGVDIAIARFNLMVKWAVSECVLTQDVEERARVLVKYIHIAAHARRLRNYATMYQITIALLSSDCSRLTHTWDLVPETERETLRMLEKLVQPLRNFSNLRHEMETAPLEDGCIPFIGK